MKRIIGIGIVLGIVFVLVECTPPGGGGGGGSTTPAAGSEGGACLEDGSCNAGLVCDASNTCVAAGNDNGGNDNSNANENTNDNSSGNTNDNDGGGDGGGGTPAERLASSDLTYVGAFRLPDDFNWGARGMTFYADGNSGAGSLLVTGFELVSDPEHPGESCWDDSWNCFAYYGEVAIPTPAVATNWEDLPAATLVGSMTAFDEGRVSTVHREYLNVSDIEYVPAQGTQSSGKLYGALSVWYAEGAYGSDSFETIWFANMDGTDAQGPLFVGPDEAPYHGRKMGAYLFSVPQWYADEYLGGRTLVTGRSRGTPVDGAEEVSTAGGSMGPTLFAFHPADSDTTSENLDAMPMLYYRVAFPGCGGPNVGEDENCDYSGFTMCDDWTGAAFVEGDGHRAIMMVGYVGLGDNCYDEPPVECDDPCSDSHGYHCDPYERQVIFYDTDAIGAAAQGEQDPWDVLPYEIWRPDEFFLQDNPCTGAGGMAFDANGGRVFMIERGLGEGEMNAAVVHVWEM